MPKQINFYNYEHGYAVSLNHKETLYTQKELNQAVEAEREACAKMSEIFLTHNKDDNYDSMWMASAKCYAKLIRSRSK